MAFELAEAYVQFTQRGLREVQGIAGRLDGDFLEAARQAQGLDRKLEQIDEGGLNRVSRSTGRVKAGFISAAAMASSFAGAAGGIGIAAGAIGMAKMAADAETLQVKLRVLLGSGEAASQMLSDINEFAANTPFEQLEISEAAQQLVAFNVPADQVLDRLKSIGDIAALTGIPLNDLSEIYGKAQVQGKLFAEDINQLTGRGIPIIQALAAEFGVTESEGRGAFREVATNRPDHSWRGPGMV